MEPVRRIPMTARNHKRTTEPPCSSLYADLSELSLTQALPHTTIWDVRSDFTLRDMPLTTPSFAGQEIA